MQYYSPGSASEATQRLTKSDVGVYNGPQAISYQFKTPRSLSSGTRLPSTMSQTVAYLVEVANHLCVIKLCLPFDLDVVEPPPA